MCVLSDRDLFARICADPPLVSRIEPWQLQPGSLDLRLGYQFRRFTSPRDDTGTLLCLPEDESFILYAHEFALATTLETVHLPADLVGVVSNKSSGGREGYQIEFAGWIDPGFVGQITLEILELRGRTIELWPGKPICQVAFMQLSSPAERPYGHPELRSRYQGQRGPTAARVSA